MHIIKITPYSFKIILSKEDLQRYGAQNIFESKELSGNFFAEIIDETNAVYGNPFKEGSIDAEFFESKDGGGELFKSTRVSDRVTYLFKTRDFENLIRLCKRLSQFFIPEQSILFVSGSEYSLLLHYKNADDLVLPCLTEYGQALKSNLIRQWILEEHAEKLVADNAVRVISQTF